MHNHNIEYLIDTYHLYISILSSGISPSSSKEIPIFECNSTCSSHFSSFRCKFSAKNRSFHDLFEHLLRNCQRISLASINAFSHEGLCDTQPISPDFFNQWRSAFSNQHSSRQTVRPVSFLYMVPPSYTELVDKASLREGFASLLVYWPSRFRVLALRISVHLCVLRNFGLQISVQDQHE